MKYTVLVLQRAKDDLDRIFDWLTRHSTLGAIRWYAAFQIAAADLRESPEGRALAPESRVFPVPVRQQFFKTHQGRTYRILFTVTEMEVYIHRIRGPGQRPVQWDDVSNDA